MKVRNNVDLNRFELDIDGHLAVANYSKLGNVITFTHTEVPPALAGKGVGSALARGALDIARSQKLEVVAECPFIAGFISKNPEFSDLLSTKHSQN